MTNNTTGVKAVIFDWAGTTVDHGSRAPASVFLEIFRRSGVEVTVAEARGPMGRAKRDHLATVLAMPRVNQAWTAKHGRAPTEADIDRLYADFLPLQKEVLAQHCDVIPGIPEMVAELRRRGIRIGSSTGYTRELMGVVVPAAKAAGYSPDVVLCAEDAPQGRPAPWLIFRACEQLGVYPIQSVVVVDDTPVGIQAGKNSGAWTVGITRTGNCIGLSQEEVKQLPPAELQTRLAAATAELKAAGADYVIESSADLLPILDKINQ